MKLSELNIVQRERIVEDLADELLRSQDGLDEDDGGAVEKYVMKRLEDGVDLMALSRDDIGCLRARLKNKLRELDEFDIKGVRV